MSTGTEFSPSEELVLQALASLSFVTGDLIYFDGAQLQRLGIGSSGSLLSVSGGIPAWSTGAMSILTATGTVDDSNVTFVFTSEPKVIVVNGATYRKNHGWTYNSGTNTATMSNAVGTGGDIFGLI